MESYSKSIEIRWSDMDPNFHLRHSVYYDFGAFVRIAFLCEAGLSPEALVQQSIGPIIFREECVFKREVRFGDAITVDLQLTRLRSDYARWTMMHQVFKSGGELCAVITLDGSWMDTKLRKLTSLPEQARPGFDLIPRSRDFILYTKD